MDLADELVVETLDLAAGVAVDGEELDFFAPGTAPRPPRPKAREPEVMMAANRTSFSPAGPTTAVCSSPRPVASSMQSVVSSTVASASSGTGSNSTPSSVTWTPTSSSLAPATSTAA